METNELDVQEAVAALDLNAEDGATEMVSVVGLATFAAAVLAVLIAAGPQIGALIVSAIEAAIAAVAGGAGGGGAAAG